MQKVVTQLRLKNCIIKRPKGKPLVQCCSSRSEKRKKRNSNERIRRKKMIEESWVIFHNSLDLEKARGLEEAIQFETMKEI